MAKEYTEFHADAKQALVARMGNLNNAVSTFDVNAKVIGTYTKRGEGGETIVYVIEKP